MTRRRRRLLVALAPVGLAVLVLVPLLGFQRWFVFPSYVRRAPAEPPAGVRGLVRLVRRTPDGDVEALYLPGHGVDASRPGPLVVFAHGNAELVDDWPEMLEPYRAMGASVLLPEYRGYGRSAGSPSEAAIVEDFAWFLREVEARPEVDRGRVAFHGRSLGGGVVCGLARARAPRALVLMSTFTSVADIMAGYFVPRALVLDPFDNAAVLGSLDVPTLLVHGRRDRVVPFGHAERLRAIAPKARLVAYDCDHNDCPPDWRAFFRVARGFLADAGVVAP